MYYITKKNGVKVISAKETIAEDSTGILLESMLEGYAEFFSVELAEKVRRGMTENALKGLNNGGGIPLGYVLNKQSQKLEVDPVTAPIVLEIFTCYAEGQTVREIVNDLNARGVQTQKKHPFRINGFGTVLKRCTKKAVKMRWIEGIVVGCTMQMVFNDTVISDITALVMEEQDKENITLPALQQQLAQTEKAIENMLNAIQQGIFTASTKQRLDELEATKEQLRISILQEQIQKPRLTVEGIRYWLCRFRELDPAKEEHRQRIPAKNCLA